MVGSWWRSDRWVFSFEEEKEIGGMMDILYSPGISFQNPTMVKTAAPTRLRPWFYQETGVGPLTKVSKQSAWSADPQLHPYTPVWKRTYKQRNFDKLAANSNEMPNFQELGEAPGPTDAVSTTSRDPLGFLTNLIAKSGDIATGVTNSMLKNASVKADINQSLVTTRFDQMNTSSMLMMAGVGVAGLIAFYLWRK